jgi:hypothetical protein
MGHDDARGGLPVPTDDRQSRALVAGVKEQNEMTIGRTDDPENPFGATAIKAAFVFGAGSRTPSGPAVMVPRQSDPMMASGGQITVSAGDHSLEDPGHGTDV